MYRIAWKSKTNPLYFGNGEHCLTLDAANSWIDYYKPSNRWKHPRFNKECDDLIHWIESSEMPSLSSPSVSLIPSVLPSVLPSVT